MGVVTSLSAFMPRAKKYQKSIRGLENKRAHMMVTNAQNAIAFREKEDPREQAFLKQSMWGRGLGKSSISDQETDRLNMIQSQRMGRLNDAFDYAMRYKAMIKKKHRYEKYNQYAQAVDSIIALWGGAGGGASGVGGANGGGDSGASLFGGGGEGGDYNFGGYA